MQAESPVAQQATRIAALESEVTRLAGAAAERTSLADDTRNTNLMRSMQARIHRDIQALIPLLSAKRRNDRKAAAEQKEPTVAPSAQTSAVTQERLVERLQADGERSQFRTSGEVSADPHSEHHRTACCGAWRTQCEDRSVDVEAGELSILRRRSFAEPTQKPTQSFLRKREIS